MNDLNNLPLVIILGPTAVGKSKRAIELAQRLDMEIINADSMQVYRGMDIGSTKTFTCPEGTGHPSPHFDIKNPDEEFSAAQFREEALNCIELLYSKGKQPLVVGGTGLYIRALRQGTLSGSPC